MRFLWIDTETTGCDPTNSAIIELGAIFVVDGEERGERDFFMNPLNDVFKFNPEAAAVNGYTEEKIKSFPSENEIAGNIIKFFSDCLHNYKTDGSSDEKCYFTGYNTKFDYDMVKAFLERHDAKIEDYFCGIVDVYAQAKKAREMGILSGYPNLKLTTVTKSLGVAHENAHTALDDIRATREVAMKLHKLGASLL